jgi:hypothetical protein
MTKIEWVKLNNGEEYFLSKIVEGVSYYVPNNEVEPVRAVCGEIESDTEFWETDDFYVGSDYNYVVYEGDMRCKFEIDT